jgi:hypothetical protein
MWFDKEDVVYSEKKFKIIKISVKKLYDKYEISNYHRNRNPDPVRINKINEYYIKNKILKIPQEIACWDRDKHLLVYDGIHRLTAARNIPDMVVFVKIMYTEEQDILDDFKNINSGVNLPFLYLEENNKDKRRVCESVMKKLCTDYSNCMSPSRNCQKQNFNRDVFIESILGTLNIDFSKKDIEISIYNSILAINNIARLYILENKISTPKKCNYYRFWLMYLPISEIKKRIENSILL